MPNNFAIEPATEPENSWKTFGLTKADCNTVRPLYIVPPFYRINRYKVKLYYSRITFYIVQLFKK